MPSPGSFINETETISLYPIPFKNELHISLNSIKASKIDIYNISGKLILSKNISSNTQSLDMSSIASGMYFAKIIASNKDIIEVKKVIKK